jgi:phage tail sheath protein FI
MTLPGVYVQVVPSGVQSIIGVPTSIAAFVGTFPCGPLGEARQILRLRDFEDGFGGPGSDGETACAIRQYFQNGGSQCYVVRAGDNGGTDSSPPVVDNLVEALSALERIDLFNLLCVPDTNRLEPGQAAAVAAAATACCAKRRAFYILDIPNTPANPIDTVAGIRRWVGANSTLRTPNAAVYFPRPMVADPAGSSRQRAIAASGSVAGVYARTDARRGVWKAPAGLDAGLLGVQALELSVTDHENGQLNAMGVNCLRHVSGKGFLCLGARTLVGTDDMSSEWKYVSVRRMTLFVEESLYRGLMWVVFEPNDEKLWTRVRLTVSEFMSNLYRIGALLGGTSDEAYVVRCDRQTTTKSDIDQGFFNLLVGFAPTKPAEFVMIRIRLSAEQARS